MTLPGRFFRPTWAEVDLSRLRSNLKRFKSRMPPKTKLMFVVKANAYGHGAVPCAKAAESSKDADWLGVSSVEEGLILRQAGVRLPVLILGSLYPFESLSAAAENGLIATVASLEAARRLSAAARRLRRPARCHIKMDTGMNRIGVGQEALLRVVEYLAPQKNVRMEGIYTHLSCADSSRAFTAAQLSRFKNALAAIEKNGTRVPLRHAANSVGALKYPSSRWDMVRPGLAIYGLYPGFEPILELKTKVVFIKNVSRGAAIGYGAGFRTRRPSRIATIPVGYADGFSRGLSDAGSALVGGRLCPVVGKISMDMTTLDVTGVKNARVGDEVVLIGSQKRGQITAREIAGVLKTIPYEVVCSISSRVPRVYKP